MTLTLIISGGLVNLDNQHAEAGPLLQRRPAGEQEVAEGVRGQGERGLQEIPCARHGEGEAESAGGSHQVPGGETPAGQTRLLLPGQGGGHQQGAKPSQAQRREEFHSRELREETRARSRPHILRVHRLRAEGDRRLGQSQRLERNHDMEVLLRQVSAL